MVGVGVNRKWSGIRVGGHVGGQWGSFLESYIWD